MAEYVEHGATCPVLYPLGDDVEAMIDACARAGTRLAFPLYGVRSFASRALLANLVGLLSQTCDATAGLLGNSLIALAREPQLRETAAQTTRDGLLAVVQETARHDPSVHNTRRFAAPLIDVPPEQP